MELPSVVDTMVRFIEESIDDAKAWDEPDPMAAPAPPTPAAEAPRNAAGWPVPRSAAPLYMRQGTPSSSTAASSGLRAGSDLGTGSERRGSAGLTPLYLRQAAASPAGDAERRKSVGTDGRQVAPLYLRRVPGQSQTQPNFSYASAVRSQPNNHAMEEPKPTPFNGHSPLSLGIGDLDTNFPPIGAGDSPRQQRRQRDLQQRQQLKEEKLQLQQQRRLQRGLGLQVDSTRTTPELDADHAARGGATTTNGVDPATSCGVTSPPPPSSSSAAAPPPAADAQPLPPLIPAFPSGCSPSVQSLLIGGGIEASVLEGRAPSLTSMLLTRSLVPGPAAGDEATPSADGSSGGSGGATPRPLAQLMTTSLLPPPTTDAPDTPQPDDPLDLLKNLNIKASPGTEALYQYFK